MYTEVEFWRDVIFYGLPTTFVLASITLAYGLGLLQTRMIAFGTALLGIFMECAISSAAFNLIPFLHPQVQAQLGTLLLIAVGVMTLALTIVRPKFVRS